MNGKRRVPFGLLLLPMLGGCGFQPMYGSGEQAAVRSLPDIFVMPMPERSGQEMRLALQQRLAGTSDAQPQGYTLSVSYSLSSEAIGINGDNSSERNRVVGRAHWVLSAVSPAAAPLATGDARSVDGYNVVNEQYFASGIASDTTQQRIANNLADAVTQQLATWFANHKAPAQAAAAPELPGHLSTDNVPGNSDQTPLTAPGEDGLPASATGRAAASPSAGP